MQLRRLVLFLAWLLEIQSRCSSYRLRRELRELSSDELQQFLDAQVKLHSNFAENSFFKEFVPIYEKNFKEINNHPQFLPWHRELLRRYELALQEIDPEVTLPYWDWGLDSQAPASSQIFTSKYFGGNGQGTNNCVSSGPFKEVRVPSSDLASSDLGCIHRNFSMNTQLPPYPPPEVLMAAVNEPAFSEFSFRMETYQGIPSDSIGFNGIYDPLFYVHHGFVDLLWAKWQDYHPTASDYEGKRYGLNVQSTEVLPGLNRVIDTVLYTRADNYCYEYPDYPRLLPDSTDDLVQLELIGKPQTEDNSEDSHAISFSSNDEESLKPEKSTLKTVASGAYNKAVQVSKAIFSFYEARKILKAINHQALVALESWETITRAAINAIALHPFIGQNYKRYQNLTLPQAINQLVMALIRLKQNYGYARPSYKKSHNSQTRMRSINSSPQSTELTTEPILTIQPPSLSWIKQRNFNPTTINDNINTANRLITALNRTPNFVSFASIRKDLQSTKNLPTPAQAEEKRQSRLDETVIIDDPTKRPFRPIPFRN